MAGFDYHGEATRIVNILTNANTTTASPYLSQDLSTTVQVIEVNDPEKIALKWRDLPAIYVRITDAQEEFESLGFTGVAGSKKRKTPTFELFGLYAKEGRSQATSSMLEHVYDMARNVEAVFQSEARLSNAALWVNPARTDFGDVIVNGEAIKGFRIDLVGTYLFR